MAEQLFFDANTSKAERYQQLVPQLKALISVEDNLIANLANIAAALKEAMGFFWVGFYLAEDESTLVLGPFQGPIACTRIHKGKGVCGTVFENKETLLVPDVDAFPGHIACSSASRSEIVLPALYPDGRVAMVLDVDSDQLDDFDQDDQQGLEQLMRVIEAKL